MKMGSDKRILWVIVRHGDEVSDLRRLEFSAEVDDHELEDERCNNAKFLQVITEQIGLSLEKTKVFKLRNGRGSLIPLSRRTPQNTVTSPYILEVCEQHSTVKPCPRQIEIPCYDETCKRRLQVFSKRISRLEDTVPQLPHLRDARLSALFCRLLSPSLTAHLKKKSVVANHSLDVSQQNNLEMKDLENRLMFLHSKLKEAESRQWKGMFTKHPLW